MQKEIEVCPSCRLILSEHSNLQLCECAMKELHDNTSSRGDDDE